jgi:hypothetical protein
MSAFGDDAAAGTDDVDRYLHVEHDGRVVCSAQVTINDDTPVARICLHSESGHIPPGSRERLVDEVLALHEVQHAEHLEASVPRGDSESLRRLQERCDQLESHTAGVTVLVKAELGLEVPGTS